MDATGSVSVPVVVLVALTRSVVDFIEIAALEVEVVLVLCSLVEMLVNVVVDVVVNVVVLASPGNSNAIAELPATSNDIPC